MSDDETAFAAPPDTELRRLEPLQGAWTSQDHTLDYETATVMGQADPGVTWKHYARLFDPSDLEARVRAAQASPEL